MQRRITRKLSETIRNAQEAEEAQEPPTRRSPRPALLVQGQQQGQYSQPSRHTQEAEEAQEPPTRRSPRPALLLQGQQQGQYNQPSRHTQEAEEAQEPPTRRSPRPALSVQEQQQGLYNQQSRRPNAASSSYFEVPEVVVPEESRPKTRNAAAFLNLTESRQSVTSRGKSKTGSSRSAESTRQSRSGSRPPPWRMEYETEALEADESSVVLSTASDDFSEEYDVDADESEDFVQNPNIVGSEILADDDTYEDDYEPTAPASRNSSRMSQRSSRQSSSDRPRKSSKKVNKTDPAPVTRKQSKSKSISFGRETKVKRESSRSKYTRSSDGEENGPERRSSSSRRGADYSGRVPSLTSARVSPRGSQALTRATMSREVMALPIEIPESVTDADAFRRYLSVRRGATIGHPTTTILPFEDHRTESCMEPTGGSNLRPGRTATNLNAQLTQGMVVHRRTVALSHAIMTLALLSASSSQLRFVVAYANAHSYPALNYFLICSCIFIEIIVGIGYVVISRVDFSDVMLEKVHSYLIFGLFFVAIANVILAAFALDDHVCEVLAKRTEQYDNLDPLPPLQSQSQSQSLSQPQPVLLPSTL